MSHYNCGPAIRGATEGEREARPKRSTSNIPVHRHAVGVSVGVDVDDQIYLHQIATEAGINLVDNAGLEPATFVASGLLRVKRNHAITIAPVTQIGMEMYLRDCSARQIAKPTFGVGRKSAVPSKYKSVADKLSRSLAKHKRFSKPIEIKDIDWYGVNNNVLVAQLDTDGEGFEALHDIHEQIMKELGGFGMKDLDIYPPDHVTLLRFGTKRRPIEFNDDNKSFARDLLRPELCGRQLSLASLALTRASGEPVPIKSGLYSTPLVSGFSMSNELEKPSLRADIAQVE